MNPGTFAGIGNRGAGGYGRYETHVLSRSEPAFLIPSWAQGGKGRVLVTGCGGGGGGGGNSATNGGKGAPGGCAMLHPIYIPDGVNQLSIAIGAAGAKGGLDAPGTNGGATTVSMLGTTVLSLGGGTGGQSETTYNEARGGVCAVYGQDVLRLASGNSTATGEQNMRGALELSLSLVIPTLRSGLGVREGNATSITPSGNATYPASLFGGGTAAVGFGFGGRGGSLSPGYDGGPGFLVLRFEEGAGA